MGMGFRSRASWDRFGLSGILVSVLPRRGGCGAGLAILPLGFAIKGVELSL